VKWRGGARCRKDPNKPLQLRSPSWRQGRAASRPRSHLGRRVRSWRSSNPCEQHRADRRQLFGPAPTGSAVLGSKQLTGCGKRRHRFRHGFFSPRHPAGAGAICRRGSPSRALHKNRAKPNNSTIAAGSKVDCDEGTGRDSVSSQSDRNRVRPVCLSCATPETTPPDSTSGPIQERRPARACRAARECHGTPYRWQQLLQGWLTPASKDRATLIALLAWRACPTRSKVSGRRWRIAGLCNGQTGVRGWLLCCSSPRW